MNLVLRQTDTDRVITVLPCKHIDIFGESKWLKEGTKLIFFVLIFQIIVIVSSSAGNGGGGHFALDTSCLETGSIQSFAIRWTLTVKKINGDPLYLINLKNICW